MNIWIYGVGVQDLATNDDGDSTLVQISVSLLDVSSNFPGSLLAYEKQTVGYVSTAAPITACPGTCTVTLNDIATNAAANEITIDTTTINLILTDYIEVELPSAYKVEGETTCLTSTITSTMC